MEDFKDFTMPRREAEAKRAAKQNDTAFTAEDKAKAINILAVFTGGFVAHRALRRGLIAWGLDEKRAKAVPGIVSAIAFLFAADFYAAKYIATKSVED